MFDILECDDALRGRLAVQFASNDGFITLPPSSMPAGFAPSIVSFVFMMNGAHVETYMPDDVSYGGASSTWQSIAGNDAVPGGYRPVHVTAGSFHDAFAELVELLALATSPPPAGVDAAVSFSSPMQVPRHAGDLVDLDAVAERRARKRVVSAEGLAELLKQHIVGQDLAVQQVARAVRRQLAKSHPERPLTICFLGPSGVGKTEVTWVLPECLRALDGELPPFGFCVLPMNEYRSEADVTRLLGASAGHVGFGEVSALVKQLAANPRSIIVFDEIDKAHPAIGIALMSAMSSGKLGLNQEIGGRHELDCSKAIFVFTSNQAAESILDEIETGGATKIHDANEVCRGQLHAAGVSTPIIGRISEFVVFKPLDAVARTKIAVLSVQRIAGEYGVELVSIDPDIIAEVLQRSGGEDFGVRPLVDVATELLGDTLVDAIAQTDPGPCRLVGMPPICKPADAGPPVNDPWSQFDAATTGRGSSDPTSEEESEPRPSLTREAPINP